VSLKTTVIGGKKHLFQGGQHNRRKNRRKNEKTKYIGTSETGSNSPERGSENLSLLKGVKAHDNPKKNRSEKLVPPKSDWSGEKRDGVV